MSLDTLLSETLVVVHSPQTATNEYGSPARGDPERKSYRGRTEQVASREVTIGSETQISDWAAYLEPAAVVDSDDLIENEQGVRFRVLGPANVVNDRHGPHHLEVRLRFAGD